jgi:nitroreductase
LRDKKINSNFSELVRRRYSCRSFSDSSIAKETERVINNYNSSISPPFSDRIRISYISRDRLKEENFFTTGTYGMIKGAKGYLIGITKTQSPQTFENFGYCMEDALLHLTRLGIDTCWIGGVFDRKTFGKILSIDGEEIVPAVIALGYAAERRTFRDKVVRWSAGGNHRKPMDRLFFETDLQTPLNLEKEQRLRQVLENVRLAPSASNKQPWRIIKEGRHLHFFLDRDKLYSKLIPNVDLQRIDLGIALYHFEMAAGEAEIPFTRKMFGNPPQSPPQFEYIISYTV